MAAPGEIQQRDLVLVAVDVRDEGDLAALQSMGYACAVWYFNALGADLTFDAHLPLILRRT